MSVTSGTTTIVSTEYKQHRVYYMGRVWYRTQLRSTLFQTAYGPHLPARLVQSTTFHVSSVRADLSGNRMHGHWDDLITIPDRRNVTVYTELPDGFIPVGAVPPF